MVLKYDATNIPGGHVILLLFQIDTSQRVGMEPALQQLFPLFQCLCVAPPPTTHWYNTVWLHTTRRTLVTPPTITSVIFSAYIPRFPYLVYSNIKPGYQIRISPPLPTTVCDFDYFAYLSTSFPHRFLPQCLVPKTHKKYHSGRLPGVCLENVFSIPRFESLTRTVALLEFYP